MNRAQNLKSSKIFSKLSEVAQIFSFFQNPCKILSNPFKIISNQILSDPFIFVGVAFVGVVDAVVVAAAVENVTFGIDIVIEKLLNLLLHLQINIHYPPF